MQPKGAAGYGLKCKNVSIHFWCCFQHVKFTALGLQNIGECLVFNTCLIPSHWVFLLNVMHKIVWFLNIYRDSIWNISLQRLYYSVSFSVRTPFELESKYLNMYLNFLYLFAVHNEAADTFLFLVKRFKIGLTAWVFLKASKIRMN